MIFRYSVSSSECFAGQTFDGNGPYQSFGSGAAGPSVSMEHFGAPGAHGLSTERMRTINIFIMVKNNYYRRRRRRRSRRR